MKRLAILVVLTVLAGFQPSFVSLAEGAAATQSHCQTATPPQSDVAKKSCCSTALQSIACCLDVCSIASGAPSTVLSFERPQQVTADTAFLTVAYLTRSDTPLIRPPIS